MCGAGWTQCSHLHAPAEYEYEHEDEGMMLNKFSDPAINQTLFNSTFKLAGGFFEESVPPTENNAARNAQPTTNPQITQRNDPLLSWSVKLKLMQVKLLGSC